MNFSSFDYKVSETIDGFIAIYYELLTEEQKNKRDDKEFEKMINGSNGHCTWI